MKLYIIQDGRIDMTADGRVVDSSPFTSREATPDEIKLAHPRCETCSNIRYNVHMKHHCFKQSEMWDLQPSKDYCMFWEAK